MQNTSKSSGLSAKTGTKGNTKITQTRPPPTKFIPRCSTKRRGGRNFLQLPGEIRNEIYKHYFHANIHVELMSASAKIPYEISGKFHKAQKTKKKDGVTVLRHHDHIGSYTYVRGLSTKWSTSHNALLFVCRQTYRETVLLLYENITFGFNSIRRINNFLHIVPPISLASITKLDLHQATYGDPDRNSLGIFRRKYEKRWADICKNITTNLTGLRILRIWLHVTCTPLRFNMQETWVKSLLAFRELQAIKEYEKESPKNTRSTARLPTISLTITTRYLRPRFFPSSRPAMKKACLELHQLFAEAICRQILGWDEVDALVDYSAALEGRHKQYQDLFLFTLP